MVPVGMPHFVLHGAKSEAVLPAGMLSGPAAAFWLALPSRYAGFRASVRADQRLRAAGIQGFADGCFRRGGLRAFGKNREKQSGFPQEARKAAGFSVYFRKSNETK